jgi:protein phosphatase
MPATGALLLVADGMGGPAAGEVASAMAARVIAARLMEAWGHHDRPTPEHVSQCVCEAMAVANGQIHSYASHDPELKGMGTTATAIVLVEDHLCVGHVGDSRAYLVRGGRAQRLTEDHSWLQHLLDTGAMSPEEAADSSHRNILLRALGPQPEVVVDVSEHRLCDGDVLVLCSDGLWSAVAEEEIVAVLGSEPNLGVACNTLVNLANVRGGRDNITVLVARLDVEDPNSTPEDATLRVTGG